MKNRMMVEKRSTVLRRCLLGMFCLVLLATSTSSIMATTGLALAAAPNDTIKDNYYHSYKSPRIQNVIDRQLVTGNLLEEKETEDIRAALASDWSPFISLEGQIRTDSSPVVIRPIPFADSRLYVFVVGVDNSLYYKTQTAPGSTSYTSYIPLGGVIRADSNPAVARNFDGRISVFVVGTDNVLYQKYQLSPGSNSWSDFESLGGQVKANTDPAAIYDPADGTIALFVIGTDNSLYVKWKTAFDSNTYGPYESLGGQIRANGHPAVYAYFIQVGPQPRYFLEVFVVGTDNMLYHRHQIGTGNSGPWAPFESLDGQIKPGTSPDVGSNLDGRLEVFVIGTDDQLYNKWQTGPGATSDSYSPYQNLLGEIEPNTSPDVTSNLDGRLEVFVVGIDNNLYHKWQNAPSSSNNYSPYEDLGGVVKDNTDADAEANSDGRLEVFIVGQDNQLYHKYRTTS